GGLPFLALALLRGSECEQLLRDTHARLNSRSWGVGLLGFVPPELREEQLAAIATCKPPWALIAGGRPDQAAQLEAQGIPTYLHVPSPGLMRRFLKSGSRRFVFEGRECGGHVGPRSSFVLWGQMCEVIEEELASRHLEAKSLSLLFAGGIHDSLSSAMLSVMVAPLAARGVRCAALMGTAYLFTPEAIACGAILPEFQRQALACRRTTLLRTGPGHAIRCAETPYCSDFERERERLLEEGRSADEVTRALEWLNLGRLRLASKGIERAADDGTAPRLESRNESDQVARGMYMLGQVAVLHDRCQSIAELHEQVSDGARKWLEPHGQVPPHVAEPAPDPCDIAIVGMACRYPGARNMAEYWRNIMEGKSTITEVPESHWDWRLYFDPDPRARDKIISKWGGFLDDMEFDPVPFGIT
ncbi:MAG TPA: beta-ketoacyl synthase N-terminal-like domain-containing protein, partial [Pirellulaceae bacterium]